MSLTAFRRNLGTYCFQSAFTKYSDPSHQKFALCKSFTYLLTYLLYRIKELVKDRLCFVASSTGSHLRVSTTFLSIHWVRCIKADSMWKVVNFHSSMMTWCTAGGEGCLQTAAASAIGIGSDIGGSIRMPAFFNGVFGHKATTGLSICCLVCHRACVCLSRCPNDNHKLRFTCCILFWFILSINPSIIIPNIIFID